MPAPKSPWLLLAACGLLLGASIAAAQPDVAPANVRGVVLELGTNAPVADVLVSVSFPDTTAGPAGAGSWAELLRRLADLPGQHLDEGRLVAFTDTSGVFEFRGVPAGPIRLHCVNSTYQPYETDDVVHAGELLEMKLWLSRSDRDDYEIIVTGRRQQKEVARLNLSAVEIEKLPGFGGDVIKSVQSLPGVARPAMTDPGAIVIRGSSSYDSRYVLDGIDIPLLFHYGGLKSTYNSLALESVDMVPGGFGVSYGNAIGGVVELTGRAPRAERWHWTADVSALDASLHGEGPLGRGWSALFTARRSYVGEILDMALSGVDDLQLALAPYYWDTVARLEWNGGPDQRLFFTAFAAKDRLDMIFPDSNLGSPEVSETIDQISLDLRFSRYILGWDRDFADGRLGNALRAAYGRSRERGQIFGFWNFEGEGPVWQLRDNLAWRASDLFTPNFGVDGIFVPYDYRVKVLGYAASIESTDFADLGAYANVEWRPTPDLLITPGVRWDHYRHIDEGVGSWRVTSRWNYDAKHTFRGAIGTYNQAPQPIGQSTDPVYGNPDLPPTRAMHLTLGDEILLDDRTSLKIDAYYNLQKDIPATTDSLDLNFVADAEARMYGLEIMLRAHAGERFFGWLSYCLSRSERSYQRWPGEERDRGVDSGRTGEWDPGAWVLSPLDQTHHLEALASWQANESWTLGARLQYVTGNPSTPMLSYEGEQYEFDADTGEYVPVYGDYLADRLDPYVRLDLRVDRSFDVGRTNWNLYLDIQNANYFVYNSPEGYTYNYDFSRRTEYGWIFLPSIGLRVEY